MQMLRFLRRVFIILILLIIVFFIFRFIKPEATSRFVDKVRNIPTTISSRFHREKKSGIVINGDTTYTNSNFEINENNDNDDEYDDEIYIPVTTDEDTDITNETDDEEDEDNGEIKDMSRLDELNKELDKILKSGNNIVVDNQNSQSWNDIQITETTWSTLPSWFVVIDVEQPYTWTNQTNTQTTTNTNTTNNNTQNNNTTTNTTTTKKCWRCSVATEWNCLSDQDCDQMMIDLGSINAHN